jgi:hypothetical protein
MLAIANSQKSRYYPDTDMAENFPRTLEFDKRNFPDSIDERWRNSLHNMYFGSTIDDDHDARMENLTPENEQWREIFASAVEGVNEARRVLLAENRFLSTQEAIGYLATKRLAIEREEFMVLRRWGNILAVPDHGRWLYPAFQFSRGTVSPYIKLVHDTLRDRYYQDPNPWIELTFWGIERDPLNGRSLKDVLWQQRMRRQVRYVIANAQI